MASNLLAMASTQLFGVSKPSIALDVPWCQVNKLILRLLTRPLGCFGKGTRQAHPLPVPIFVGYTTSNPSKVI